MDFASRALGTPHSTRRQSPPLRAPTTVRAHAPRSLARWLRQKSECPCCKKRCVMRNDVFRVYTSLEDGGPHATQPPPRPAAEVVSTRPVRRGARLGTPMRWRAPLRWRQEGGCARRRKPRRTPRRRSHSQSRGCKVCPRPRMRARAPCRLRLRGRLPSVAYEAFLLAALRAQGCGRTSPRREASATRRSRSCRLRGSRSTARFAAAPTHPLTGRRPGA